jgi:hypothetical protein
VMPLAFDNCELVPVSAVCLFLIEKGNRPLMSATPIPWVCGKPVDYLVDDNVSSILDCFNVICVTVI